MNDACPPCPECGTPMRLYGRGATARKRGVRYICPQAIREDDADRDPVTGRYRGEPTAHVQGARLWRPWDLEEGR